MSPAMTVSRSLAIDCMTAIPDGPPAPVTSTRPGRSTGIGYLLGGRCERVVGARVGLAHDLQRFDVTGLGEAAPVARGRAHQLLVEVGAHRRLRGEGADHLQLSVDVGVD